jgi:hypothetical protein
MKSPRRAALIVAALITAAVSALAYAACRRDIAHLNRQPGRSDAVRPDRVRKLPALASRFSSYMGLGAGSTREWISPRGWPPANSA